MRLAILVVLAIAFPAIAQDVPTCMAADKTADAEGAAACWDRVLQTTADLHARVQPLSLGAWAHWRTGDFEGARKLFGELLAASRELGSKPLETSTTNFLGLLHQILGDQAAALDFYRRAEVMARELGDRKLQGEVLYHLGWIHFLRHDHATAVKYYEQSLAARRDAGDRKGEGLTLAGLGMTCSAMGRYDQALQYEQEALPLIRESGDRRGEADAHDHIGIALTFLHRPEEAIEEHTKALSIREAIADRWGKPMSLTGLAHAKHELGRTAEAAEHMAEIIGILETGRRKLSTKRFRASLFAGVVGHYERYINLLEELHRDADALSASEGARARLTLDAVQEALARADAKAGRTLLRRADALRDELERSLVPPAEKTAELAALEDEIRAAYPKLAAARNAQPFTAAQIQSELLDGDTAMVEYFLGSEKSLAWVATPSTIEARELPKRATVEQAAVRLHELLSAGDQRARRHDLDAAAARLASLILAPLPLPRGARRLIIVPDGALFYVPFAALPTPRGPLVDRYEITMAPSASALILLRQSGARAAASASLAVFADPVFRSDDPRVRGRQASAARNDPDLTRSAGDIGLKTLQRLPATRIEAETIASLAPGPTRKALDFDASREAVLQEELGRYRVVHFATHALVNTQHPELSGIVLSLVDRRGQPVDGFLRVPDLYSLRGATDLVVLSACRTAAGKQLRGEGIVGLVSGFMHGGTPRIVASYWNVKDQPTAEVMKRFYRGLFADHLPPAAALRAAQRSMRNEERWQSPYYWAAFALYGLP